VRKNTTDSGPCPLTAHGSNGVEIRDIVRWHDWWVKM